MRKRGSMERAVATTVLSLLIVVILIPAAIAQPPPISVSCKRVNDSDGTTALENGDLVQLFNATTNTHICYIEIGEGNCGLPGCFIRTVEGIEEGTVIKCRAWNAPSYEEATHYGDSISLTVTGAGTYDFPSWSTDTSPAQPPVPDLPALILFASGLVLISVYFVYGRRKKKE